MRNDEGDGNSEDDDETDSKTHGGHFSAHHYAVMMPPISKVAAFCPHVLSKIACVVILFIYALRSNTAKKICTTPLAMKGSGHLEGQALCRTSQR